jgi:hypothetical protein
MFHSHHSYGHLLVIPGYFYGIIHSIYGVFLVLIPGITRALPAVITNLCRISSIHSLLQISIGPT